MTTVLKLGGSVITRKDEPETLDEAAIDAATTDIAESAIDSAGGLVLVHGGGSFGHHHAAARGVSRVEGTRNATDARAIHDAMRRLNSALIDALQADGVPALPVSPLSAGRRDDAGGLDLATSPVVTMLAEGFCPVLHGDVVATAGAGVAVVSGDELVVELARSLPTERVGLCSTVPGVLDVDGDVVARVDDFEDVADALGESVATDVTGGMAAKVRALLGLPVPASVFGADDLQAFLDGEQPGTLVDGRNGEDEASP